MQELEEGFKKRKTKKTKTCSCTLLWCFFVLFFHAFISTWCGLVLICVSLKNPPGCVQESFYLETYSGRGSRREELNSGSRWGDNYGVANETDQRGNNFSVGRTNTLSTHSHNINTQTYTDIQSSAHIPSVWC